MLRITPQKSAADAKRYYTQPDYYVKDAEQEVMGPWGGKLAERLGLRGKATEKDFHALCDNLDPRTGERLTVRQKDERIVGWDITVDGPKGFAVLLALTQDERMEQTFCASNEEVMGLIEGDATTRVRRKGEQADRRTDNLAWSTHDHHTTRPVDGVPDMNRHRHNFVFNATLDPVEGKVKAVKFRPIVQDAPYYEAVFNAALSSRLAALGFEIERKGKDFEIVGVPQTVLDKFSRRKELIEQEAKKRNITDPKKKAELGAKTREKKANDLTMEQLRELWIKRLDKAEFDAVADTNEKAQARGPAAPRVTAKAALEYAIAHCFYSESVVTERKLLTTALHFGYGSVRIENVQEELARADLIAEEIDGRRMVTTREVLAEEQAAVAFAREGRGSCSPAAAKEHRFKNQQLNAGQRAAVRHVLASCDRVLMIRGAAGTGKTTMMKEAIPALEAQGLAVRTFAPSAGARDVLRKAGFGNAETVAMLLKDERIQESLQGGTIWIDEAGMLGGRDLAKVFAIAEEQNARVVLSGDPRQHKSPARGSPMVLLEKHAGLKPVEITEIVRQKVGKLKQAVAALSEGRAQAGFDQLVEQGCVREIADPEERRRALAEAFAEATRPVKGKNGKAKERTALVISPTHSEGREIIDAIRSKLKEEGRIAGEEREALALEPVHASDAQRSDAALYHAGMVVLHQHAKGFTAGERLAFDEQKLTDQQGRERDLALLRAQPSRFAVYRTGSIRLASGDKIRFTANGRTKDGKHRLVNGSIHGLQGFTTQGDLVLENGWIVPRDFGHVAHGYLTSHASQGKDADAVFIAQGSRSLGATSREQFYVSVSRGKENVHVFTDDALALREAIQKTEQRLLASDLVTEAAKEKPQPIRRRKRLLDHAQFLQRHLTTRAREDLERGIDNTPARVPERKHERGLEHDR